MAQLKNIDITSLRQGARGFHGALAFYTQTSPAVHLGGLSHRFRESLLGAGGSRKAEASRFLEVANTGGIR